MVPGWFFGEGGGEVVLGGSGSWGLVFTMTQKLWEDDHLCSGAVFRHRWSLCEVVQARFLRCRLRANAHNCHASPLCTKSQFAAMRSCGNSGELKREYVRALVEKGTLKRKVKFVLCAESNLGKFHIIQNGTMCWCGCQWSQGVWEECKSGQMQRASPIVGRGVAMMA